jgi:hypothetical protein
MNEIKDKVEKENKTPDLTKQVANIAFTVRKIKNWMEEKMGADIDGDGKIGSGPHKKVLAFLAVVGASCLMIGNIWANEYKSNIANWYGTEANMQTYIDKNGNIGAPAVTAATLGVNGTLNVNNLAVKTNATVGGTLGVTGVATLTATPVLKNGLTVQTNATIGGTLDVQGNIIGANDEYIVNNQNTYWKCAGHWVSLGDGTFNLGASTQQWNYLYLKTDATIGGAVDAKNFTCDPAEGLDVQAAGVLELGAATATGIEVSKSGVMTTVKGTANFDEAVTLDSTIGVAGTATFDGTAIYGCDGTGTNVFEVLLTSTHRGRVQLVKDLIVGYGGGNAASGDLLCYDQGNTNIFAIDSSARTIVMLGDVDATTFDGDGADITGLNAANITAGTIVSAIDISAATNANASELKSGTVANARLDTDLQTLALNNGGSLTNLQAASALIGVVPLANGGAGNASGILKANGAGLVSAASSTTDYVAPIAQVSGVSTAALVATATFQSSIAGVQHLTGWLSESAGGVAVGTNCTSIAGANSTVVLAGGGDGVAYAVWSSKSDGLSTLTITTKATQTGLYFNTVQHNGVVVSTPAFDVAP